MSTTAAVLVLPARIRKIPVKIRHRQPSNRLLVPASMHAEPANK